VVQIFNINISHNRTTDPMIFSAQLENQNLVIKQKMMIIAKAIYSSTSTLERKSIDQICFNFIDRDHFQVKLVKEGNETDYPVSQLDEENQLRSLELTRLVYELGTECLSSPDAEEWQANVREFNGKLAHPSNNENIIARLFRTILRWYHNTYTLKPSINEFASTYFVYLTNVKELKNKWQNSENNVRKFADKLWEQINQGRTSENIPFSKEEILEQVQAQLELHFQKLYQSFTSSTIGSQEMRLLLNEKKIHEAAIPLGNLFAEQQQRIEDADYATNQEIEKDIQDDQEYLANLQRIKQEIEKKLSEKHFVQELENKNQKDLREMEEEINQTLQDIAEAQKTLVDNEKFAKRQIEELHKAQHQWQQTLSLMPILDIPLETLAYVPVNVYTEESLIRTWELIFKELIEQGKLEAIGQEEDPALFIKQTRYGDTYLLARQLLPKELEEVLKPLIDTIDSQEIERFIRSQPNALELKSFPSLDQDQKRQTVYQHLVKSLMDETLDQLFKEQKDFVSMAESLKDRHSPFLEEWAEKAVKRLEVNGIHEKDRQDLNLTKEQLIDCIIVAVEELGVNSYHISGEQLARLAQARSDLEEQRKLSKQAEILLKEFKGQILTFKKKMGALDQSIDVEKKRSIPLIMQIPDLEVPLLQLDRETFQEYIDQQENELKRIQTEISNIRKKGGKKAIVSPQLISEVNRLKQKHLPMLREALGQWEKREKMIKPVDLTVTLLGSKRDLLSLNQKEIALVESNFDLVQKRVQKIKKIGENSSDQKIKSNLQKQNVLLGQLQQILENPIKSQERDQAIKQMEKEKKALQEEHTQCVFENLGDLPVVEMSIELLRDLPVIEANEPLMRIFWASILKELKGAQTLENRSEKVKLQYIEALKILNELQAPTSFKRSMAQYVEKLEKSAEATRELLGQFHDLDDLISSYDQKIQEVQARFPSQNVAIPAFNMTWTEASSDRVQILLNDKRQEMEALKKNMQKQKTHLSEIQANINHYDTIKDPKIKRKGGLQILNRKLADLKLKVKKNEELRSELRLEINKLELILSGHEVELGVNDIIEGAAYEGRIEDISANEWVILERILQETEELLKIPQTVKAQKVMEKKSREIRALLDLRQEMVDLRVTVEKLEDEKAEKMEKAQSQLKESFKQIDSAAVRVYKLARLPIHPANEALIVEMWQELLQNCLTAGELEYLSEVVETELQISEDYASQYLAIKKVLGEVENPAVQLMLQQFDQGHKSVGTHEFANLDSQLKSFVEQRIEGRLAQRASLEPTGPELLFGPIEIPPTPGLDEPILSSSKKKEALLFNSYEIENLKLLTKALNQIEAKRQLSKEEKDQVNAFVSYARMNDPNSKALNGKLSALMDRKPLDMKAMIKEVAFGILEEDKRPFKKVPYGISEEAVEIAMTLTFNFKTPQYFALLVDRLEHLLEKIEHREEIKPEDQFTRRELGLLQKCAKLGRDLAEEDKSLLSKLEGVGVLERSPDLMELQKLSNKSQILLKQAQDNFAAQIDYQDGDLVANVGRQKLELAGRKAYSEEEIHFRLITPYCHGAKIYKDQDKVMQSHVIGNYIQDEFTLSEELYSEVWRLNVAALVPSTTHVLLEGHYGKEWQKILQQKYQAIENHIQKNKAGQFSQLKNPWDRRIHAGKADFIWGGHARKTERDFGKMADRILAEKEDQEQMTIMICSEFVTKTTLAALVKLNRELSQELGDFLIQKEQKEEGEKLKAKGHLFELPYSKKEKFQDIHPGRMIDLLVKRKCVTRLKKPEIVQQLLRP
jgi:hypothetical protein